MDNQQLLKSISFGAPVAEDEVSELAGYFVQTDQWDRISRGEIDVVRGDKGAGKSAIYSLLTTRADQFFDQGILLIPAEKPRGATVFKDIVSEPPASEQEFIGLWKLYVAALIAEKLRDYDIKNDDAAFCIKTLQDAGLLEKDFDLAGVLRLAQSYARAWFRPKGAEGTVSVDPNTGLITGAFKITPSEPEAFQKKAGAISVDTLLRRLNNALEAAKYKVWVLLDRLDVAFAETHALEANALRALLRVYRDLSDHNAIVLKIFLRSDIWRRITEGGFREASHITRFVVIEWSSPSLLNLVMRRLLKNKPLQEFYSANPEKVLADFAEQSELFYKIFPPKVEQGSKKPNTLDWIVSRCADANGKTAPREIVQLLSALREQEIARLQRGEVIPTDGQLFDRSVFKTALPSVSESRLIQNMYAEYPDLRPLMEKLRKEKTEQTPESLSKLWSMDSAEALSWAQKLIEIGFFQRRGSREAPTFWVPFLYRDALSMSQGLAEEE
jgi:hypothetical protein